MNAILVGLRNTFEGRAYRVFGTLTFAASLAFYLMTLPSSFTGGRIGIAALRYLDFELVAFSVVMATLVAMLLPLMVFQYRRGQRTSKTSAAGGVALGVMTPILCCSPLLPVALGFVATFFPTLVGAIGWRIQGFIATHQTELLAVASILLAVAVYQNARSVARGPNCALPASPPLSDDGMAPSRAGSAPASGGGASP